MSNMQSNLCGESEEVVNNGEWHPLRDSSKQKNAGGDVSNRNSSSRMSFCKRRDRVDTHVCFHPL